MAYVSMTTYDDHRCANFSLVTGLTETSELVTVAQMQVSAAEFSVII
jgi:hypothetical protein